MTSSPPDNRPWKCPYCMVLIADEEEYYEHLDICDRVFYFAVEILEDCSGSINTRRYSFSEGEEVNIWYELYRILESQGRCRRL